MIYFGIYGTNYLSWKPLYDFIASWPGSLDIEDWPSRDLRNPPAIAALRRRSLAKRCDENIESPSAVLVPVNNASQCQCLRLPSLAEEPPA